MFHDWTADSTARPRYVTNSACCLAAISGGRLAAEDRAFETRCKQLRNATGVVSMDMGDDQQLEGIGREIDSSH